MGVASAEWAGEFVGVASAGGAVRARARPLRPRGPVSTVTEARGSATSQSPRNGNVRAEGRNCQKQRHVIFGSEALQGGYMGLGGKGESGVICEEATGQVKGGWAEDTQGHSILFP